MAKTLLSVVSTACRELALPVPTAVAASTDQQTTQMWALANALGQELVQAFDWPVLRKVATLTMVNGTSTYTVVNGTFACDHIICETGWDSTNQWRFAGSVSDQIWNAWVYGVVTTPIDKIFRTTDIDQVEVFPTPTASGDTLVLSYITADWVTGAASATQSEFLADADVHLFDERLFVLGLKYKFLRAKGLSYDEEYDQFQKQLDLRRAQTRPAQTLSITGGARGPRLLNYDNVPETGYGV